MVHVFGIDHWIQDHRLLNFDPMVVPIEQEQKGRFGNSIETVLLKEGINFLGEEAHPDRQTIASVIAEQQGIRYTKIDMPLEEREAQGIPRNYAELYRNTPVLLSRCHGIREQYMVERVENERQSLDRILVVCGIDHMQSLWRLFSERGHEVSTLNVMKSEWCCGDLLTEFFRRESI